jgi:hypothetical protein
MKEINLFYTKLLSIKIVLSKLLFFPLLCNVAVAQRIIGSEWCLRLQVQSYPLFALYFYMQYKGAAWLSRVRHGSFRMRHGSVGSVLACCTAAPSSNPGSALQGGFSC